MTWSRQSGEGTCRRKPAASPSSASAARTACGDAAHSAASASGTSRLAHACPNGRKRRIPGIVPPLDVAPCSATRLLDDARAAGGNRCENAYEYVCKAAPAASPASTMAASSGARPEQPDTGVHARGPRFETSRHCLWEGKMLQLKRNLLSIALASAVAFTAMQAHAQEAAPSDQDDAVELDRVKVTGIRSAIEKSIDAKQSSTSIVEAISAEDIG